MHTYILLDRSGSMESMWDEALSSVNTYAADLKALPAAKITLAAFDAYEGVKFDVLRRNVDAEQWTPVRADEASPRGGTPLFDSIGRILALAEEDADERTVIVVMTDGHENQSREMTKETLKARLERAEKRGWQVVFLGAEFAQFDDAQGLGVVGSKRMAMSAGSMDETMTRMAQKVRLYAASGASVDFDDEDRLAAREEQVKQGKA